VRKVKITVAQLSASRGLRHRRFFRFGILLVSTITFLLLSRSIWLPWIGEWLVTSDTPEPADLIVVLGGDFWGHRVVEGADLGLQGYAAHVMISGPDYRSNGVLVPEGEMATRFLTDKGYPRSLFCTFSHHAASTIEEARALAPELKRLKVKRVLIVTSNYHSRRASLVFHAILPFSEVRVIGAPEDYFQPESWWKTAASRKLVRSEWRKILGTIMLGWILRLQAMNL
jgi:uncharacterized SAM-binding protein YcdF (DUF218 family)